MVVCCWCQINYWTETILWSLIKKAEKTDVWVIMDKEEYRQKLVLEEHLLTDTYEQANEDANKKVYAELVCPQSKIFTIVICPPSKVYTKAVRPPPRVYCIYKDVSTFPCN